MTDEEIMRRCIALAEKATENGDVPVGAVVVRRSSGEIVGEGYNRREADGCSLAHAELMAIKQASETLGGWHLTDCALYVTLEPCAMCAGAVINSRVDEVIWGASDPRFGACGSKIDLFSLGFNHTPAVRSGVLADECAALLKSFFRKLRERGKRRSRGGDVND
ncbi:tRNA(adenine34) deaminase [Ruminococcus sp. YE71]|uniref:tRNA adenosine(34) deaminase TadA n=1 Tax=unclassified Ruminococcus TaxID=2608920 RepID=UPI0008802B6F|nr:MULTISPECIES: tRNA adenosine(34) deaminase TadA [unclassified Ruminococcus]SDA13941.1 tRNA(adenine34) deaminase [Ruminococcus sp. YE78]SFW20170.1 tRNA(adenine34) deaminase [Ruminococcus sp. YE71]